MFCLKFWNSIVCVSYLGSRGGDWSRTIRSKSLTSFIGVGAAATHPHWRSLCWGGRGEGVGGADERRRRGRTLKSAATISERSWTSRVRKTDRRDGPGGQPQGVIAGRLIPFTNWGWGVHHSSPGGKTRPGSSLWFSRCLARKHYTVRMGTKSDWGKLLCA